MVPKPITSNSAADGRYEKWDFTYLPKRDAYRCPAGEYAIRRFASHENGLTFYKYWSSACPRCALRAKCTTGDYRRLTRWEHEAVLDRMQARLERDPTLMIGPQANGGAYVRHDQSLDGRHPLLVSTTTEGERRDEPCTFWRTT